MSAIVTRNYPITLPSCEPVRDGETVIDHGARVLAFLLDTSCTATLSDLELERAEYAAQYAIVARGISIPAANRLSDIRHLIAFMLKDRQASNGHGPVQGGSLDQRPPEGPMARLLDRPIVDPRSPAGKVDIRF